MRPRSWIGGLAAVLLALAGPSASGPAEAAPLAVKDGLAAAARTAASDIVAVRARGGGGGGGVRMGGGGARYSGGGFRSAMPIARAPRIVQHHVPHRPRVGHRRLYYGAPLLLAPSLYGYSYYHDCPLVRRKVHTCWEDEDGDEQCGVRWVTQSSCY